MVYKVLIIFFSMCIVFNTVGQNKSAKLIIGAAATQVDGDDIGGYNKIGIVVGMGVSSPLNNDFEFQPELLYFQKGSKQGANTSSILNLNFHYIEIPLMISREVIDRVEVQAGPSIGYLFKASGNVGGRNENILEDMNRVDLSLFLGGNYRLSDYWNLKVRYGISLKSVSQTGTQRNNTVSFLFEYQL